MITITTMRISMIITMVTITTSTVARAIAGSGRDDAMRWRREDVSARYSLTDDACTSGTAMMRAEGSIRACG